MRNIILSAAVLAVMSTACKKAEDKALDTTTKTDTAVVVKDEAPAAPMDSVAMQKKWMEYMTPGEVHKQLAMDNGNWNEDVTMWMAPDAKPMMSKSTAMSKMILGGRYQEMTHKGTFMGQPFEGIGTLGYDNASKKMVSSWVDNMGTGIMYMSGDYGGKSKTIEFKGEVTDPMTGKVKPSREIFTMVDDNTRKMEMYDVTPDGKEFKCMEITMTRKK